MKDKIIFSTAILGLLISSCNQTSKNKTAVSIYKAKTFETANSQYGYDVFKDSVMVIHQPIIPGVQGNKGFSTKEDAQKVAELMIYKLEHGTSPPSITIKELDSLNVKASN